jgi:hypothetical protein
MAALTFSALQTEVFDQSGLDSTDTNNQTRVQRWINYVQQDICARWPWPFMLGRESIVTVPDYITGKVSVNTGSTSVTGSGNTFTATHGSGQYFIQFAGANDWYRVTASTPPTSLTIEQPYQPTTNAVNVTYTLRCFFYSLSATADEIIDVRNWNTPIKLLQVDLRTVDFLNPLVQSTNAPYGYMMFGYDASNNLQLIPYPFPSDGRLFEIRTKKRPTDMVNTGDLPSIPNKYAHIIAFGATSIAFAFARKLEEATAWNNKFEARITQMKSEYKQSEDMQMILGSIDSQARSRWIQFPEQYPVLRS